MAKVWLSVAVLFLVEIVYANICNNAEYIRSCDECIRCAGSWCQNPEPGHPHCTTALTDDFCGGHQVKLPTIPSQSLATKGNVFNPAYAERGIQVGGVDNFYFTYPSAQTREASASILNMTLGIDSSKINDVIELKMEDAECKDNLCTQLLEIKAYAGVCRMYSTIEEFLYVNIKVANITEEVIVKYHVPCACECSKKKQLKSTLLCSGHGDYACGACKCFEPWTGEDCSQHVCGKDRGDDRCTSPFNRMECSGNGDCKTCDTCTCFVNKEGYQYFDHTAFCSDVCMDTSRYGDCITNNTMGLCDDNHEHSVPLTMMPYNEINKNMYAAEGNLSRPWIRCNDTFPVGKKDKCYVEYLASKNDMGFAVMVVQSCKDHRTGSYIAGTGSSNVPIILGVLLLIAAVAAVVGFMLWKHFNSVPPMPFSSPDYQNIEAEDCVGENPIYKNPTTTFTNPQYGKC